jgi:hypothetical protein
MSRDQGSSNPCTSIASPVFVPVPVRCSYPITHVLPSCRTWGLIPTSNLLTTSQNTHGSWMASWFCCQCSEAVKRSSHFMAGRVTNFGDERISSRSTLLPTSRPQSKNRSRGRGNAKASGKKHIAIRNFNSCAERWNLK